MRKYLYEILTLLGKDKKRLPRILILFLVVSLVDLAGISLIGPYVAMVSSSSTTNEIVLKLGTWIDLPSDFESLLILMGLVLIGIFLIKAVMSIWINFIIVRFGADQQIRLRCQLIKSYMSLPYSLYLNRNSSEYIHSTQTMVNHYAEGVVNTLLKALSDGIVAFVILMLLAWTNPFALLLLVSLLGLFFIIFDTIFRKRIRKFGQMSNIASTSMVQAIHESIEGLKEIRIFGNEKYFQNQVNVCAINYGKYYVQSTVLSSVPRYFFEFIMVFFVVFLVVMTIMLDQKVELLLPTLGMFGVAAMRLLPAANSLSSSLMKLRFYRDSVSKLYRDLTFISSANISGKNNQRLLKKNHVKELRLKNISFCYTNARKDAIHQLSMDIKCGESIGLVGPSGSGKTTLVDVILGLLVPQSGEILFNGDSLETSLAEWRSHIAYIPQQVFLLDNSLRRNVALGIEDKDIDEKLLMDALNKARLTELVDQLPEGLDTLLGERGIRLSGGQRQRIALARAFYHERDVLVMDEATSALDYETEREIVAEILRLKGKKTMIVIAHRLSTVQNCDRIYKLENGNIIAFGSPKEILGIN